MDDAVFLALPGGPATIGFEVDEARALAAVYAAHARRQGPPELALGGWGDPDHDEWARTHADPEWVEARLLTRNPRREIVVPPYEIQTRPVSHGELLWFVLQHPEHEQSWPPLHLRSSSEHGPARDVPFAVAVAFASSHGGRLPFEDEWELAARRADIFVDPKLREWCADRWDDPFDPWSRVQRGGAEFDDVMPSIMFRHPGNPFRNVANASFRVVRESSRAMPSHAPSPPAWKLDSHEVRPTAARPRVQSASSATASRPPPRPAAPPSRRVRTSAAPARSIESLGPWGKDGTTAFAWSPDGRNVLAWSVRGDITLYERRVDSLVAVRTAEVPRGPGVVAYSADGLHVATTDLGRVVLRRAADLSFVAEATVEGASFAFGGAGTWIRAAR